MVITRLLFFLLISLGVLNAGAQITLSVGGAHATLVDPQKRGYRVQAGVPFECTIEMSQATTQNPQVDFGGGQGLQPLGVSKAYRNINGKVTISHSHQFLAPKTGQYTLGPVNVIDGPNKYTTDALSIEAVSGPVQGALSRGRGGRASQQARQQAPQVDPTTDSTVIKISVDDADPYINQPVVLTINHYFSDGVLDYQTIQPKIEGFAVKEIGADTDTRDQSGKRVIQKKFLLTPISTGKKKIDPVEVHYLMPRARQARQAGGDIFDLFLGDFMDLRPEQKKTLSNALELDVQALPPYKGRVDAVGAFTSFKASLDKESVPVYETIKYTIRLEGEGNLEQVTAPQLSLPAAIKTYESKSEIIQSLQFGSLDGEKKFEYVLQPRKPGVLEIPSQRFTFFNYKKGEYETLRTEPLKIEVTGEAEAQTSEAPTEAEVRKEEAKKVQQKEEHRQEEALQELVKNAKVKTSTIPWYYFLALVLLLPLVLFWRNLLSLRSLFARKKTPGMAVETALARVKNLSESAIFDGTLHKVMVEVFIARYGSSNYTTDLFKSQLKNDGLSFEDIDRLLQFMDHCASLPFSTTLRASGSAKTIQQEATRWLERLNKK